MRNLRNQPLVLIAAVLCMVGFAWAATAVAQDASPKLMRACHDYLWQQPDFKDLPNAAVSVVGGKVLDTGRTRVHWQVEWDNIHARGVCIMRTDGSVYDFKVQQKEEDWAHGEADDFYYDTRSRRWKDPSGEVCNTCTPENGFDRPHTDGDFYYDGEIRKWRDSNHKGAVCHTCTPENGFPIPPN